MREKPATMRVELRSRTGKTEVYNCVHRIEERDAGTILAIEYRISGGLVTDEFDALDWGVTSVVQEE